MSTFDPETAADRYRELIEWLGDAYSRKRGWQRIVAQLLEVSPTYISRVRSRNLTRVTPEAIDKATKVIVTYIDETFDPAWFQSDGSRSVDEALSNRRRMWRPTDKSRESDPALTFNALMNPSVRITREAREMASELSADYFNLAGAVPVEAVRELARLVLSAPPVTLAQRVEAETDPKRCRELGMALSLAILAEAGDQR